MRHFVSTTDWAPDEIESLLQHAIDAKAGRRSDSLPGKVMGMVFMNSSLRTRTSFEAGMFQMGGHAINLSVGEGMWKLEAADGVVMDGDAAEHVKEAVPVLSRYVDVLGLRAFPEGKDWAADKLDPVISSFAAHSAVPVVNMESSMWHPCQALADALTWKEKGVKNGDKVVVSWAYHPKALPMAVPNSALVMAAQRGMEVTVLRPEPFALDAGVMQTAKDLAAETGGSVTETDDAAALEGAKVVYAKSWGSLEAYGAPDQEKSIRADYNDWQVTADWMGRTDGGIFMHCLPVRRNVVVADAVLDSAASVVVDQAENRLHAQNALLVELLGGKG
ncbi:MAG: N-acetylornithine carbamoyltransferase [Deltaproteobacteria bacterium]|nr:N-acetylornithine carbamoyltransferase [Deltaproteobacteria bacterium]